VDIVIIAGVFCALVGNRKSGQSSESSRREISRGQWRQLCRR